MANEDLSGEAARAASAYIELPEQAGSNPAVRRETARRLFDTVADAYERSRPGYPEALYADLRAHGLSPGADVLEVGCGTGQATQALAAVANQVCCIELGPDLARRAQEKLVHLGNVSVVVGAFEEVPLRQASFDLVFSATAFHWIDPAVGYERAARLLRLGGSLALCTNAHVAGGTQAEISDEVRSLHETICPDVGTWEFPSAQVLTERALAGGDIAHVWSRIDRRFDAAPDVSDFFTLPFVRTYPWTATYKTDDYLLMLGTQSPYLVLDADRRDRLFDGIARQIDDRLGGVVTKEYLAILAACRRVD